MTSQEKFETLLRHWNSGYQPDISWIKGYLHLHLRSEKYPKFYQKLEDLRKSENWQENVPANGKILMVNLIYEQFKKDGLI